MPSHPVAHPAHPAELRLVAGRSHPALAASLASELGVELTPLSIQDFSSGETLVRVEDNVRGCDVFALQSFPAPVNEYVVETLLMIDALKRAAARSITLVLPFFPYSRQDKKGHGREPISARVLADVFRSTGASQLMSVDLHTDQLQGFFDGPVDHLHMLGLLAEHVSQTYGSEPLTVVSPDAGRVKSADKWADRLGAPLAILHKRRDTEVLNQVKVLELVGEVRGRTCVLVDDMIDTAGTITQAAAALKDRGAARVIVAATHPVLSGPALDRLAASSIDSVVVTDTLPVNLTALPESLRDRLVVLPVAPLLAESIAAAFSGGSITLMFEGQG